MYVFVYVRYIYDWSNSKTSTTKTTKYYPLYQYRLKIQTITDANSRVVKQFKNLFEIFQELQCHRLYNDFAYMHTYKHGYIRERLIPKKKVIYVKKVLSKG